MANEPYRLTQTGEQVQQDLNDMEALAPVTEEAAGLMSAADKAKLDGIDPGAEENTIETVKVNGTALVPDANKAVNVNVPGPEIFVAVYGTTTSAQVWAAYSAGKTVLMKDGEFIFVAASIEETYATFANVQEGGSIFYMAVLNSDNWSVVSSQIPDVSAKADKVSSPTAGNFAGLDSNGNLTDSGKKASDFLTTQKQADWNESDSSDPAYIKNKPNIPAGVVVDQTYDGTSANAQSGVAMSGALATKQDTINDLSDIRSGAAAGATAVQPEAGKGLFSGSYTDLTNKPTIPDAQIQSDWNQSDNTAKDYIKNKPSIPAAQVNSDWNANSGVAQILNKPSIPDAVEANPTVPSGTTPTDLTGLKVGSSYYGIPSPTVDNAPTKNSANLVKSGGVYAEVHPGIVTTQPVGGFAPGIVYDLGTLTGTVTFALASATDNTVPNAYHWTFETGSTEPTIHWPSGIIWPDNVTPTIEAGKHYEVLVRNGYASIIVYTLPTE